MEQTKKFQPPPDTLIRAITGAYPAGVLTDVQIRCPADLSPSLREVRA